MAAPSDLEFYFMCFMPYIYLPEDHRKYPSVWVDFSNKFYDPAKGKQLYERYLSEFTLAEKLGFDGLVVNEHHNTAYSMMPSVAVIASALIQRTNRAKIGVWGTPINLEYPNRLAEEYAMLDVMSGGRLEVALPLGTGMEYWANPVSPATARERFRESVDIMIKAWSEDGPISYSGKFYNYRYLNVWPRPMQKPHPKVYVVGSGSAETVDFAAEKGFGYSVVFLPIEQQLKAFDRLRENAAKAGHTITPDQIPIGVIAYVAETDEIAEREFHDHLKFLFENLFRTTGRFLAPPGYITVEEFRRRAMSGFGKSHGTFDWDLIRKQQRVVAGSPDTVASAIAKWAKDANSTKIVAHLHSGDMPHWKTVKNLTLFAEEVIPRLRKATKPSRRVEMPLEEAVPMQGVK